MATRDDDKFRVRPSPPKSGRRGSDGRFVSRALKAASLAGSLQRSSRAGRPDSSFGRGRAAAGLAGRGLGRNARRVVIKSRYVILKRASAQSVATHLRYIARDGVTRSGERGQAYGEDTDRADLKAFEERGRGDRHQFRFILSVEDAPQLDDLREYTRAFMQRMSADLETRLDWVAVDHWDTDNPHTHIVLRGRAGDGQDLVIAPDYMAHGMRTRAQEIATQWLGPRTELEIQASLRKEATQDRLTSLDGQLLRRAQDHHILLQDDSKGLASSGRTAPPLGARLQHLEALGLAEKMARHHWKLDPQLREKLTALSARGDIIQTMHRALKGQARELALTDTPQAPVVGQVIAKGIADEMRDTAYVVVDGMDGRAHYVSLPADADLGKFPMGSIVAVSDRAGGQDAAPNSRMQQRRALMLLCDIPVEQQVRFVGPTWLDHRLAAGATTSNLRGFGAIADSSLHRRADYLVGEGLAHRQGAEIRVAPDLLKALRDREIVSEGTKLSKALGRSFREPQSGDVLSGTLIGKHKLACGDFGAIDDGLSVSLVPWRPSFAAQQGQQISLRLGLNRGITR